MNLEIAAKSGEFSFNASPFYPYMLSCLLDVYQVLKLLHISGFDSCSHLIVPLGTRVIGLQNTFGQCLILMQFYIYICFLRKEWKTILLYLE
jgi:hypothetical protein